MRKSITEVRTIYLIIEYRLRRWYKVAWRYVFSENTRGEEDEVQRETLKITLLKLPDQEFRENMYSLVNE